MSDPRLVWAMTVGGLVLFLVALFVLTGFIQLAAAIVGAILFGFGAGKLRRR